MKVVVALVKNISAPLGLQQLLQQIMQEFKRKYMAQEQQL